MLLMMLTEKLWAPLSLGTRLARQQQAMRDKLRDCAQLGCEYVTVRGWSKLMARLKGDELYAPADGPP